MTRAQSRPPPVHRLPHTHHTPHTHMHTHTHTHTRTHTHARTHIHSTQPKFTGSRIGLLYQQVAEMYRSQVNSIKTNASSSAAAADDANEDMY